MSEQRLTQSPEKAKQRNARRESRPDSAPSLHGGLHPLLQLQRTIGNRAVNRLLQSRTLQAKLTVSQPHDPYEQEADRVAEQVMRMPDPTIQRTCAPCAAGGPPCPKCADEKKPTVQRKADLPAAPAQQGVPDYFIHDLGSGQPLDSATRAFFEPRFGYDFSNVRLHADHHAAESAKAAGARAYTVGEHIVFGSRQFSPGTTSGRELMAHELTHVIQQGRADVTRQPEEETDDGRLPEDDRLSVSSSTLNVSRQVTPTLGAGLRLQRAACPCCVDLVSIGNISRIDTPARMGHSFDTTFALSYPASGPQGSCTLEWWEKTNVPAIPGMPANTWTDMYKLMGGASFDSWNKRQEECATSTAVVDTDPPSLSRTPGRTVTRTLEFRIVVNSMPPTSEGGCENATQQVTATQVLTMVNSAPDWAASSFTTP